MLYHPRDEVGLVLFGTTATANGVHAEMAAAGEPGQYLHVTEAHGWVGVGVAQLQGHLGGGWLRTGGRLRCTVPLVAQPADAVCHLQARAPRPRPPAHPAQP